MHAFNESDVEEYEICATLDSKTSDICREMDGKHFPMSEYELGKTAPPFHPFCRSLVIPYSADGNISDEDKALFEEYKKVLGELSPES
ncbi:MAG: minor capsid protein, partial [Eubacterium sp.]|nr:minor capsid protein [Eubacterium sp.]